jgi:hypothetical protein
MSLTPALAYLRTDIPPHVRCPGSAGYGEWRYLATTRNPLRRARGDASDGSSSGSNGA